MATRILVVEDEPDIATILTLMLETAGYEVAVAQTLGSARHVLAESTPPALTLLDVALPDGNGLDLCHVLRRRWPEHPILVLTALADPATARAATAAGCPEVIVKPFDPDTVLASVAHRLGRARAA
ncbi:MAG TPA: response regulator [Thermodesulfobacteriota bacterium]